MADVPESIAVANGGFSLPTSEILTGRGFITGKSGSGKSNTASVIAESLLEHGLPLLVVDTDGEYYGLTGRFELLHVGADADCDATVGVEHAETIAELALVQNVPVILDLSGYLDEDEGRELLRRVLEHLFGLGKRVRKPFLVFVEEIHEFLPQTGKVDGLSDTLITVAKRGRKRGIGLCGMSQRPAAVDKDYITQCDWVVWHRLTWEHDKRVASQMLGADLARDIDDLATGEGLLMTDWDARVERVQFRRKRTYDAGATPDLDDLAADRYQPVHSELLEELSGEGRDLNDVDFEQLAAGRRVPDPPPAPDADSLDEAVESVDTIRVGDEDDGDRGPARIGTADMGRVGDGGRDVVGRRAEARTYTPPEPVDDEPFDPVWELGHLVVYVVSLVGAALFGVVAVVLGVVRAVRWAVWRVLDGIDRVLVRPVARDLERLSSGEVPDRVVVVAVLLLLVAAGALLYPP